MIVWERMLILFSKALSWNATQQLKGMDYDTCKDMNDAQKCYAM